MAFLINNVSSFKLPLLFLHEFFTEVVFMATILYTSIMSTIDVKIRCYHMYEFYFKTFIQHKCKLQEEWSMPIKANFY